MEDNFNFSQLKEKNVNKFYMDESIAQIFFNEIIIAAALEDKEKFEKLIELNLPWFHSFSIEKNYKVEEGRSGGYELDDVTEYFPTFIHQAAYIFSDEYCLCLLQNLLLIDKNSDPVEENLRDYIDYNRNQLMQNKNQYYLVKLLLLQDNIKSLTYLQNMEVVDQDLILQTIFLKDYAQLEKYGNFILENNVQMKEYFLGTSDGKKKGKMNELLKKTLDNYSYSYSEKVHKLIPFFDKIIKDYPEYKNQLFEAFLPLLFSHKIDDEDRMHILTEFVLNNKLSVHDLYSYTTESIVENKSEAADAKPILNILRLSQKFLDTLIVLKKEKLEKELENKNINIPKQKL